MIRPVELRDAEWSALGLVGNDFPGAASAKNDTAKRADDAEERAAIRAGIPFRRALLIAARTAYHRVPLFEIALQKSVGRMVIATM